jgi:hypothetical protein
MELRVEEHPSMLMVSGYLVILSTGNTGCKGWTLLGALGCSWPCPRRFLYLPVDTKPRVPLPGRMRRETSVRRAKARSSGMESGTGVSANCAESDEPI